MLCSIYAVKELYFTLHLRTKKLYCFAHICRVTQQVSPVYFDLLINPYFWYIIAFIFSLFKTLYLCVYFHVIINFQLQCIIRMLLALLCNYEHELT